MNSKDSTSGKTPSIAPSRIRELRHGLNISADAFSRRCGITVRYLLCIEEGKYPVTENFIRAVVDAFDVSEEWLAEETDTPAICKESPMGEYSVAEAAVDRLTQVFEESGLSQREFCKRMGTSNASLSCVLSGKQKFTEKLAKKIESEFGVGADWLLFGDERNKDYPCGEKMIGFLKRHPEKRETVWGWMREDGKE